MQSLSCAVVAAHDHHPHPHHRHSRHQHPRRRRRQHRHHHHHHYHHRCLSPFPLESPRWRTPAPPRPVAPSAKPWPPLPLSSSFAATMGRSWQLGTTALLSPSSGSRRHLVQQSANKASLDGRDELMTGDAFIVSMSADTTRAQQCIQFRSMATILCPLTSGTSQLRPQMRNPCPTPRPRWRSQRPASQRPTPRPRCRHQ